jgi:hypothetical protein
MIKNAKDFLWFFLEVPMTWAAWGGKVAVVAGVADNQSLAVVDVYDPTGHLRQICFTYLQGLMTGPL